MATPVGTPDGLSVLAGPQTHGIVVRLVQAHVAPGSRVLDCPTGSGALTRELQIAGYSVVSGDLFPENFRLDSGCVPVDMQQRFPFGDGEFDAMVVVEGIEHIEDQFHCVRECQRILRPGGHLLITTPNILNLASRLQFLFTGFWSLFDSPMNEHRKDPTHDHIAPIAYPWLHYILHTNGFQVAAVATDKYRKSARCLRFLIPACHVLTSRALRNEEDPAQHATNDEMLPHLLSREILFGRTLIVLAVKR